MPVFESHPAPSWADVRHNDAAGAAPPPPPEVFVSVESLDGTLCSICLEGEDIDVVELTCGGCHRFHRGCISPWLETERGTSRTCPLCRRRQRRHRCRGTLNTSYDSGVFESEPRRSFAHAREGSEFDQTGPSFFQSQPTVSRADASANAGAIDASQTQRRQTVFENRPAISRADVTREIFALAAMRPTPAGTVRAALNSLETRLVSESTTPSSRGVTGTCPEQPRRRRLSAPASWIRS